MSDTFINLTKISQDPGFQQRVNFAMVQQAITVSSEAVSTPMHNQRAAFAKVVMQGSYSVQAAAIAALATLPVSSEATFAAGSPGFNVADSDITTAIAACWSAMAGAFD